MAEVAKGEEERDLAKNRLTVSSQAGTNGGGIENYAHLILRNVTVSNNLGVVGGGIYNGRG